MIRIGFDADRELAELRASLGARYDEALLRHAAARGLKDYRLVHERSHVVLYERTRAGLAARLGHRMRLLRPGR